MDLRKFGITREQALLGAGLFDYQPFILSDDIQTGIAYDWLYGDTDRYGFHDPHRYVVKRNEVDSGTWQRFVSANAILRNMYEQWIDAISSTARHKESVVDIACNTGYFLQGLAQRGFKVCTGYDRFDKSRAFHLLNTLTGANVRFQHEMYNSWTHTVKGCQPADVVIASAIMVHISDPLYFLRFLGDITRDTLFLFTSVAHSEDYSIRYHPPNKYYKADEFPVCFDVNWISIPLLMLGLDRVGFREIVELQRDDSWLPQEWCRDYKFLICQK